MLELSTEKLSLEEICKKYKLSEEEHKKIGKSINEIMLYGKVSVQNPKIYLWMMNFLNKKY